MRIERANVARLKQELTALHELQQLTQHIAASCQQRVHKQICEVVSACLAAIFPNPYTFHIRFVSKRGRTEAVPVFARNGSEVAPLDAAGGGVVDVSVFALRLASIVSASPSIRRVLVLDEPWRFVAKALRPKLATMVETLSKKMKCQIILTTHETEFKMGTVVNLKDHL